MPSEYEINKRLQGVTHNIFTVVTDVTAYTSITLYVCKRIIEEDDEKNSYKDK